jgi:hypothetical protein
MSRRGSSAGHDMVMGSTNHELCVPQVLAIQHKALGTNDSLLGLFHHLKPLKRAVVPLNKCLNLAPAGTGTVFLYDRLKQMPEAASFVTHDHGVRISPAHPPRSAYVNATRCAIITLRDPADRLASGMRFDADKCRLSGWMSSRTGYQCMYSPHGFNSSSINVSRVRHSCCAVPLSTWIEGLRNSSSGQLHEGSVAALNARNGHNNFLVPQIDYLRGLSQCGVQTELHILCTERLSSDWSTLLSQHSGVAEANHTSWAVANQRNTPRTSALSGGGDVWLLSKEDRSYWNECLFPWDARMHKHMCGKEDGMKSFLVPPPTGCDTDVR